MIFIHCSAVPIATVCRDNKLSDDFRARVQILILLTLVLSNRVKSNSNTLDPLQYCTNGVELESTLKLLDPKRGWTMATGSSTFTACNRLLQKKWDDKKLKEHKERVSLLIIVWFCSRC